MNFKRLGSTIALIIILAFPAYPTMVSFLLVEIGLNESPALPEQTLLWEGGLMHAFFDSGYIVTNSPVTRMRERPAVCLSGVVEADFNDAIEGGAEYFVLGFISYHIQGGRPTPVGIEIKLYDTLTREVIYQNTFPAGAGGVNLRAEEQIARDAGQVISAQIGNRW